MDIMTTLFDQDYITKLYGDERERKGAREGKREGKREGRREGKREVVLAGIKAGVSKELLKTMTGFSDKEIEKIISESK